jgi:hypothetical protein
MKKITMYREGIIFNIKGREYFAPLDWNCFYSKWGCQGTWCPHFNREEDCCSIATTLEVTSSTCPYRDGSTCLAGMYASWRCEVGNGKCEITVYEW